MNGSPIFSWAHGGNWDTFISQHIYLFTYLLVYLFSIGDSLAFSETWLAYVRMAMGISLIMTSLRQNNKANRIGHLSSSTSPFYIYFYIFSPIFLCPLSILTHIPTRLGFIWKYISSNFFSSLKYPYPWCPYWILKEYYYWKFKCNLSYFRIFFFIINKTSSISRH